jgi:hypothetical protein
LIGAVSPESILITMESNWIQMLSLKMTKGDENSCVTAGDDRKESHVNTTQPLLYGRVMATGSITIMASTALRLFLILGNTGLEQVTDCSSRAAGCSKSQTSHPPNPSAPGRAVPR